MPLLALTAVLQWRGWPRFLGVSWFNNQSVFPAGGDAAVGSRLNPKLWLQPVDTSKQVGPCESQRFFKRLPTYDHTQRECRLTPLSVWADERARQRIGFASEELWLADTLIPGRRLPLPVNTLSVVTALRLSAGPDTISAKAPRDARARDAVRVLLHLNVKQLLKRRKVSKLEGKMRRIWTCCGDCNTTQLV